MELSHTYLVFAFRGIMDRATGQLERHTPGRKEGRKGGLLRLSRSRNSQPWRAEARACVTMHRTGQSRNVYKVALHDSIYNNHTFKSASDSKKMAVAIWRLLIRQREPITRDPFTRRDAILRLKNQPGLCAETDRPD